MKVSINRKLEKIDNLPTLPQITQRALSALEEDVSAKKLEKIISEDQVLAARLLKLANSPLYKGSQDVTSVRQAIVRLGTGEVRNVVLTMALKYILRPSSIYNHFDITRLWIHALAVGRAAYLLGKEEKIEEIDTIYTLGLLHDIGRLTLAVFFPEEFLHVLAIAEAKGVSFYEAEQELDISHAEIGAEVVKRWRFPPYMVEAIRYHHQPKSQNTFHKAAFLIFKADLITRLIGLTPEKELLEPPSWPKDFPFNKIHLAKVLHLLKDEKEKLLSFWRDLIAV